MVTTDKKRVILNAALDEFSYNTYESASLNRILKTAGASKSSFYHFFKDKNALYSYLLLDSLNIKNKFLSDTMTHKQFETLPDYLFQYLEAGLQLAQEYPALQRLSTIYNTDSSSPISREWLYTHGDFSNLNNVLDRVIEKSRKDGCISSEHSDVFVTGVIGLLFGQFNTLFPELDINDKSMVEDAVARTIQFVMNGLK